MKQLRLTLAATIICCFTGIACQTTPPSEPVVDAPQQNVNKGAVKTTIPHAPSQPASWAPPRCPESPYRLCTQSDFREANFANNELSGHVVFFNANLEDSNFDGTNLSNSALHFVSFAASSLQAANLSGSDLPGATLWGANLERSQLRNINCLGCDFNLANLRDSDLNGANLKGASFEYADLRGADLSQTDLSQTYWHHTICPDGTLSTMHQNCGGHLLTEKVPCEPGPGAQCADQELDRLDWRLVNLMNANLEAADLRETMLNGSNLKKINLAHANLRGANLTDADLLGANLARADLENVYWKNTRCPDGTLSSDNGDTCGGHLETYKPLCHIRPGAKCQNMDLSGLDLSYANLKGADLRGTNLTGSRLKAANLNDTRLQNANLEGADLSYADMKNALTEDSDLTEIITKHTSCNESMKKQSGLNCLP